MRINHIVLFQTMIAIITGVGVMWLHRYMGGPGANLIPGFLGALIAWLVITALLSEIARHRTRTEP